MFTAILCLDCVCLWLAFELYWQAQKADAVAKSLRDQGRKSHEYLRAQLPRGCVNVRKTVAVDYAQGIPNQFDWDDELDKTQAIPDDERGSGMRPKVK